MQKEQITELIQIVNNWQKESDIKKVSNSLKRINNYKDVDHQLLDKLSQCVISFHKQICKSQDIPQQWFQSTIKIKKHLKKIQQDLKKQKSKKPTLDKKKSSVTIQIPPILLQGKKQQQKQILKYLYKSFMTNYDPKQLTPKVIPFILDVFKQLGQLFVSKYDFIPQSKHTEYNKRVDQICMNLIRQNAQKAKHQMLIGNKTAKQLAENNQLVYIDQEQQHRRRQALFQAQLRACDTTFYEGVKRKINKDASQQCRFCHQPAAYCQDMKQIRAADQPMTRFMRCNNCNKGWRD